jgi:hypothetical protein
MPSQARRPDLKTMVLARTPHRCPKDDGQSLETTTMPLRRYPISETRPSPPRRRRRVKHDGRQPRATAATPRQQRQLKHNVADLWTRFPLYRICHRLEHGSASRTITTTSGRRPRHLNHTPVLKATPLPRARHCCLKNDSAHLEMTAPA